MLNKKLLLLSFVLAASAVTVQAASPCNESRDGGLSNVPPAVSPRNSSGIRASQVDTFGEADSDKSALSAESDKSAVSNLSSSCDAPKIITRNQMAITSVVLVGAAAGAWLWAKRKK